MPDGLLGRPHYLVAGVGIEPTPGGYGPPDLPLVYPAAFSLAESSIDARLGGREVLCDFKLAKHAFILCNRAAHERLGKVERGTFVRDLVAHLMGFPSIRERIEIG